MIFRGSLDKYKKGFDNNLEFSPNKFNNKISLTDAQ